jgi:intracellular septation protein A
MTAQAITAPPTPLAGARFGPRQVGEIFRPLATDMVTTLFFAGLYALTRNLLLAAGVGVAIGVAQIAWRLATRRPIAAMQWASLALVVVFASAAVIAHDARIVMVKPTVIYLVLGVATLQPGWMVRYGPKMTVSPIPRSAIVKAGYWIAALMFVSAALNLYFALASDARTWAIFIAIWPPVSKFGGFGLTFAALGVIARRNKQAGRFFPGPAAELEAAR